MKALCVIFVALITATWLLPVYGHGDKSTVDTALFVGVDSAPAKTVTRFHAALVAGDVATARALLADDVLIFEGGVERSADQYASHHMLSDMKFLKQMKQKILEHKVDIYGDTAVSSRRTHTTGTYKEKAIDSLGFETLHLVKTTSGWKISHIHWSRK
ncbi:YybH family protein [Simiduia aestuariiviva]|uniref:Ketosteroid isomerase-like protein n=1 Tax=Simiduia aestuariiviva TaxID=1510459 RepID=A0A839UPW8_9GAMM|nr:nuclear transport factor 2 family protein [Simiduia aestuariiviva]MBB3167425.1 ketosteroid isomerase-like protein [Simiduia aestuariiviva]